MAHPLFQRRNSLSKAPDYSAKQDTRDVLSGKKKTWPEVEYSPAKQDDPKRCHECVNYLKPGQEKSDCAKVVGVIQAAGVCNLWKQREYNDRPDEAAPAITVTVQSGG